MSREFTAALLQQAADAANKARGLDPTSLERLRNAEALQIQAAAAASLADALERIAGALERAAAAEERIAAARTARKGPGREVQSRGGTRN